MFYRVDSDLSFKARVDIRIFTILDEVIYSNRHHSPTANHFYRLRERLNSGKKLTKKMSDNLGWIIKDAIKEIEREDKNK